MQNSVHDPHGVKDHGELTSDRHQGAFAPFGSLHPAAHALSADGLVDRVTIILAAA
jgi:hypothetical protein